MKNEPHPEVSIYFEDILKNKDMIKEMYKTNIMVYEDKLKQSKEKSSLLKEELDKINSEFQLVENKLKLEYAKNHDEFQKHDINCKLLDKTLTHYKMLIREREDEVKKLEEQSIFAHQDYQNKKVKNDCLTVQIIEAEFQLKNFQKQLNEKVNKIIEEDGTNLSQMNNNLSNLDISDISKIDNASIRTEIPQVSIGNFLKEKMPYKSSYTDKSEIYQTLSMNTQDLRKKHCLIF